MPLKFAVSRRRASFLNPFDKFNRSDLTFEVRTDPLTGHKARILPFRVKDLGRVDHGVFLERSASRPCPFCPDNLAKMASRFLADQAPDGHLTRGEATCFPNAFPYESLNAVVVLTHEHYPTPGELDPARLADGFLLAAEAFRRLGKGLAYGSVNWNYMMPAGAGLVHPHFQIAAGRTPTTFQTRLRARARAFARRGEGDLAAAYLAAEEAAGERWLGRRGAFGWTAAFAPRAIMDLMALAPGRGLPDLDESEVLELAAGVCRVLAFFVERGVGAHNMALHTGLAPGADLPLMLRLVSRVDIPPLGVDEINYYEKLHDETLSFLPPEELARDLAPRFREP